MIITGSNYSTVTSVKFNGTSAAFIINNSGQVTATVPVGATTGLISVTNPCGTVSSASSFTVTPSSVTLNLKVYIEGFYLSGGLMAAVADPVGHPALCDTFTIELHNAASPYGVAQSVSGPIATNGLGSFVYPSAVTGNSYYVVIRHRNALETWSKNPVLFNASTISLDLTSP
ncbi:MAG: hypothetical protein NT126_05840 [Bacteroidetes bacterium]|nr:hypothetical protein [Bacteroidota bacterium]